MRVLGEHRSSYSPAMASAWVPVAVKEGKEKMQFEKQQRRNSTPGRRFTNNRTCIGLELDDNSSSSSSSASFDVVNANNKINFWKAKQAAEAATAGTTTTKTTTTTNQRPVPLSTSTSTSTATSTSTSLVKQRQQAFQNQRSQSMGNIGAGTAHRGFVLSTNSNKSNKVISYKNASNLNDSATSVKTAQNAKTKQGPEQKRRSSITFSLPSSPKRNQQPPPSKTNNDNYNDNCIQQNKSHNHNKNDSDSAVVASFHDSVSKRASIFDSLASKNINKKENNTSNKHNTSTATFVVPQSPLSPPPPNAIDDEASLGSLTMSPKFTPTRKKFPAVSPSYLRQRFGGNKFASCSHLQINLDDDNDDNNDNDESQTDQISSQQKKKQEPPVSPFTTLKHHRLSKKRPKSILRGSSYSRLSKSCSVLDVMDASSPRLTFSTHVTTYEIPKINAKNTDFSLLFYDEDEIAQFKHEKFCEEIGVDPNSLPDE